MVERAVGAQLAHVDAFIGASSRNPPFMISWKRLCCSICSEKCRVLHALVSCAGLSFDVSARFGSRRSLSHSLREPPIVRLSALFSLPCASAAVPLSPCSVSALMFLCQVSLCYAASHLRLLQSLCFRVFLRFGCWHRGVPASCEKMQGDENW